MTTDGSDRSSAPEADLAIERALEAANLRAGDALVTSTETVSEEREPTAAEAGDTSFGADGD